MSSKTTCEISFGYDPYAPPEEVAALAAGAVAFRELARATGLSVKETGDRDIDLRVATPDTAAACAFLGQVLDAGLSQGLREVIVWEGTDGSKPVKALNTVLRAHGQEPFAHGSEWSRAVESEWARHVADSAAMKQAYEALIASGTPLRARLHDGRTGWADEFAVHPRAGRNVLISLDEGGQVWGYDTSWTPVIRVKAADGRQGWADYVGSDLPSAVQLDDGTALSIYNGGPDGYKPIEALHLQLISYPSAPAATGLQSVSVTLPLTLTLAASEGQSAVEIEAALRAMAKRIVVYGAVPASARGVELALDGRPIKDDEEGKAELAEQLAQIDQVNRLFRDLGSRI